MKYYVIVGERSGDMHVSKAIKALREQNKTAIFRGIGGDEMTNVGVEIFKPYRLLSIMGFWEVVKNLFTILKHLKECKQDILQWKPDRLILVDFPGFNLKIAKFAYQHNIPVHYYISPKLWAWKESRITQIRKHVNRMYCIFPFETRFYKKHLMDVAYVGNPTHELVQEYRAKNPAPDDHETENIIALLPGSRQQEVKHMMKLVPDLCNQHPNVQFVVAGVNNVPQYLYNTPNITNLKIVFERPLDVLNQALGAVVTSGTATLETALLGVPQIVCYRTSWLTYWVAKLLVKIKHISLVNIIAEKAVVAEYLQGAYNIKNISGFIDKVVDKDQSILEMKAEYSKIKTLLGDKKPSIELAKNLST